MPSKKTTRAAKSVRGKKRSRLTAAIGPKATVTVVICVLAGGLIVGAHQQSRPRPLPASDVHVDMTPVPDATARKPVVSNTSGAGPADTASVSKAPSMTITGCLERNDAAYWIKDASGADAPKSRSWKSGFLKKSPAPIGVVDASHALRLGDYVGRRVSLTGTLIDRQMQARSLRRLASSCSN